MGVQCASQQQNPYHHYHPPDSSVLWHGGHITMTDPHMQVLYGADKQSWSAICGALSKGAVKDGEVTLVLERARVEDG